MFFIYKMLVINRLCLTKVAGAYAQYKQLVKIRLQKCQICHFFLIKSDRFVIFLFSALFSWPIPYLI